MSENLTKNITDCLEKDHDGKMHPQTKSQSVNDGNVSDSNSSWEDDDEDVFYKMVFVVNSQLKMGAGKVASQVGHATLGLYKILKKDFEKYGHSLEEWDDTGEKKITLKGIDKAELLDLQKIAEEKDLPTYLVEDAGKTQIPEGAVTILSIFGDDDTVNEVTGKLRLL